MKGRRPPCAALPNDPVGISRGARAERLALYGWIFAKNVPMYACTSDEMRRIRWFPVSAT